MTKKNWFLIGTMIVLLLVYVCFFTGWFQPQTIKIFHTTRNLRPRVTRSSEGMPNLIFGFNQRLKVTEIELFNLADFQTNSKTLPLWHLVSNSNSIPIKSFFYGQRIRGLKPFVPGARPQPLTTNVAYRLIVEAGKLKGKHDFELK